MEETILAVSKLRKNYKDVVALKGISFEVRRGEVFGILGPNGSGKTTTLAILLGILNATEGNFSWFSNGAKTENRLRIGALLETPNFYPYLNAIDNLRITAKIKGVSNPDNEIDRVLELVNLHERAKSKFSSYSLGMKQRLAIASALISDPEVLVLDEPTNGLDPVGIMDIRMLIQDLAKSGKTIIIASHILDEMEKICTEVIILRTGELIQTGNLTDIIGKTSAIHIYCAELDSAYQILVTNNIQVLEKKDGELIIDSQNTTGAQINELLAKNNIFCERIYSVKKSLENAFFEILNHETTSIN